MNIKEINIAGTIIKKRREKGMTQENLARYIGVSKASVSKWETGQSYPDITFLPQLATLFNISIDELMGYEPQMSKEDIRKLHIKLSADFASEPFDKVLESCRDITKKYFSCFPLLFQIGALLVNNSMESGDREKSRSVIAEAKELFIRVKKESDDAQLVHLALHMEALCALMMGNPNEVLGLLEGTSRKIISTETLLASAYQMTGKPTEAKFILQTAMYQYLVSLFAVFSDYLMLCTDDPERFDETFRRANAISDAFDLRNLHPMLLVRIYIVSAQGYTLLGNMDKALEILEKYTNLVTGNIYPLELKGDNYFDRLGDWIEDFDSGSAPPRSEKTIRKSLADGVVNNPVFATLAENSRYKRIVEKLKSNCQQQGAF